MEKSESQKSLRIAKRPPSSTDSLKFTFRIVVNQPDLILKKGS
jgi:hypothetical protein